MSRPAFSARTCGTRAPGCWPRTGSRRAGPPRSRPRWRPRRTPRVGDLAGLLGGDLGAASRRSANSAMKTGSRLIRSIAGVLGGEPAGQLDPLLGRARRQLLESRCRTRRCCSSAAYFSKTGTPSGLMYQLISGLPESLPHDDSRVATRPRVAAVDRPLRHDAEISPPLRRPAAEERRPSRAIRH